jgi:hypothetical protein
MLPPADESILLSPYRTVRPFARLKSLPIAACLVLGAVGCGPASATETRTPSGEVAVAAPTLAFIAQNTPGYSEGFPAGVPKTYSWCNGMYKPAGNGEPPSDFTAVTALGSIYPKYGEPEYANPDARIVIANAKTYVRTRTTKEWILVQDQSEDEIAGAHFATNAARNSAIEMQIEPRDGAIVVSSPPPARNGTFWIVKRGAYTAGAVDAVYVQVDMKTTDPKMKLIANVGADWWRTPDAAYTLGVTNSQGAGNSNWVELSTEWSTLLFYSGSTEQFVADPPPPFAESALATKPAHAPRAANTPSPCLRVLAPR